MANNGLQNIEKALRNSNAFMSKMSAINSEKEAAENELNQLLDRCNFTDDEKNKIENLFYIKLVSSENRNRIGKEMNTEFGNVPYNNRSAANTGGYRNKKRTTKKSKASKKAKKSRKSRSSKK
jgi:hypothetical protein